MATGVAHGGQTLSHCIFIRWRETRLRCASCRASCSAIRQGKILYDKFYEAEFARYDLGVYLPKLYHDESDLVVAVRNRSALSLESKCEMR
jgi:hypothetical protein